MKKYLIIALISLLLFGCKKRELTIEKLEITSESVVKSTTSIKVSASYTYVATLKSVVGYISRNSDMSTASSANATVNGNQFVIDFENLAENTLYYYCIECNNGVDIIKTDVKTVQTDFPGLIKGEFSVSATQKVSFSQGNLQYRASTDTWRFAENQFVCIGENNSNISSTCSDGEPATILQMLQRIISIIRHSPTGVPTRSPTAAMQPTYGGL